MAVVRRLHPFISSLDTHVMETEIEAGASPKGLIIKKWEPMAKKWY